MSTVHSSIFLQTAKRKKSAFTLVELLVVIGIIAILAVIVATSFSNILSSSYDSQLSQIANTFVRARAYAMANNTYVFVGVEEVAASVPAGAVPQTSNSIGGAIAIAVIAMNDGSRGYDPSVGTPLSVTTALTVSPPQRFDNIHLVACPVGSTNGLLSFTSTLSNNMPSGLTASNVANLGGTANSTLQFSWPFSGSSKYTFSNVIQFNPQGEGQVISGANTDGLLQWIEMDLEPSHGSVLPTGSSPNNAAILIDGVSGAIRTFRT